MKTLLCLTLVLLGAGNLCATPFKLTVQLDWVAEPEHGGFYQAQAQGFFAAGLLEKEGLTPFHLCRARFMVSSLDESFTRMMMEPTKTTL